MRNTIVSSTFLTYTHRETGESVTGVMEESLDGGSVEVGEIAGEEEEEEEEEEGLKSTSSRTWYESFSSHTHTHTHTHTHSTGASFSISSCSCCVTEKLGGA